MGKIGIDVIIDGFRVGQVGTRSTFERGPQLEGLVGVTLGPHDFTGGHGSGHDGLQKSLLHVALSGGHDLTKILTGTLAYGFQSG